MNRRTLVIGTAAIAALLFVVGWFTVDRSASPVLKNDAPTGSALIRFHSPVIGPQDAPVTIVEFFDPACEACRCLLYTSPSPRDGLLSRMPSSA